MDWRHSILVQSLLFFHLNKLEPLVAFLVDIEHLLSGGWHVEYLCLGILVIYGDCSIGRCCCADVGDGFAYETKIMAFRRMVLVDFFSGRGTCCQWWKCWMIFCWSWSVVNDWCAGWKMQYFCRYLVHSGKSLGWHRLHWNKVFD